jgi:hypothetical protein
MIGALLVLVTGLALLPALHAHLAGAGGSAAVAFATSGPAPDAADGSLPCSLCRVSGQTRFVEAARGLASAPSPPTRSLRLVAAEQPIAPGAPLRRTAPPRAPPFLRS